MKKLILVLFIVCSTMTFAMPTEQADTEEAIHIGQGMILSTQSLTENNIERKTTISAAYPQIKAAHLEKNAARFNQQVQQLVDNEINQFNQYVTADLVHMRTLPASVQRNDLTIDYDVDVLRPKNDLIISVRLNIEGMQAGRAHPYHVHKVLNFDFKKGKSLALNDLFKTRTDFLKIIAEKSRQQLLAKLPDKWMVNKGTLRDPKNYANWNIQNDTLLITFSEYQVAPYSYGPQEVEIPYHELKKLLAPNSVINACVIHPENCAAI